MADWTNEKPSEDGYYWLRREGYEDSVVKIWDIQAGLVEFKAKVAFIGACWNHSLCGVDDQWQWQGPIEPMEPYIEKSIGEDRQIDNQPIVGFTLGYAIPGDSMATMVGNEIILYQDAVERYKRLKGDIEDFIVLI